MNYIDLFSGIGGFALGAYLSGFKCENHFFSEIDNFCIELYKKRFLDSINLGDIKNINTEELKRYGKDWIITGGFPCQDISNAGEKAGITGKRSGLWFEYWRIIRDLRPRFAIIENVAALVNRGLNRVLESLAEIGYNAEWQIISAAQIGLPHKRERIWIVAYPESFRWNEVSNEIKMEKLYKSFEKKSRYWSEFQFFNSRNNQYVFSKESESRICGKNDGLSFEVDRFKGLGNSIVPQISQYLFLLIKKYGV